MKIGEALSLRARQAQQLDDLRGRIRANALVQEGEAPAEDPNELIGQFEALSEEHAALVEKIAVTNANVWHDSERLLSMLHRREVLRRKRNVLMGAALAASVAPNRFMRTEIKFVPQVNVRELRTTVDQIENDLRELDAKIQMVNWETDLVEG